LTGVVSTYVAYPRRLAGLILMIATTNFFNRCNVSTRQTAGAWG
jgi:hypothetical protein